MSRSPFPHKPTWLLQQTWSELLANCNEEPVCQHCGETDFLLLSIDHITARYLGGTDDLSNLQFLCFRCNTKKGIRPDQYWGQSFYWDLHPNRENFRAAQLEEGFNRILSHADWFTRPFSQISRKLYLLAWIVGAGKTLAVPAITFALNHIIGRDRGTSVPRASRIAVFSKEQSNRDQMANDLAEDLVKYGIMETPPRVHVVKDGQHWTSHKYLDQYDVVCACVQQLWEDNGKPRPDLQKILAHFSVIFFDEPHFALNQVLGIVEAASTSLCFGLTGSPIYASGDTIKKFSLLSLYDYQAADEKDRSLKYLTDKPEEFHNFFEEIQVNEADVINQGESITTPEPDRLWHPKNNAPAKAVAERVVQYISDRDKVMGKTAALAPHRSRGERASLHYPMHAMIRAESIRAARELSAMLNEMFQNNRARYPREKGYAADYVCSDNGEADARPLTAKHPWMLAKLNGGKLHKNSARFLVVVGIAREGVNNPLCGVVGLACHVESLIEIIQRSIGRQLRAWTQFENDLFQVAEARADTVKVISHTAFGNTLPVKGGIKFLCNMREELSDLPTMADLKNGQLTPDQEAVILDDQVLTTTEKLALTDQIGRHILDGTDAPVDDIIRGVVGENEKLQARAQQYLDELRQEPEKAWEKTTRNRARNDRSDLLPAEIIKREYLSFEPTEAELEQFVKTHFPQFVPQLKNPDVIPILCALYAQHVEKFHIGEIPPLDTLDTIRKRIAGEAFRNFGKAFIGEQREVHILVARAVKCLLGVPREQVASIGSDWDTPQCHAILTRPEVRKDILDFTRTQLIYKGLCPTYAAGFGMEPDEEEATDDIN